MGPIPGAGRSRAPRRSHWSLAIALSLAAHLGVFLAVVTSVEHQLPRIEDEAMVVTLDRPYVPPPPPPPEPPKPQPVARTPQPRPETKMAVRPVDSPQPTTVAPVPLPAGAAGTGQAPASRAPGGQMAGPPAPGGAKFNCLGRYLEKLDNKQRLECERQVYAFIDRKTGQPLPPAIDPAKQAAYDATAARKAYRRAPISRLGNDTATDCPNSNNGLGCTPITIPMTGDAGERFRNGQREPRTQ